MKTAKQTKREAKHLFRLCIVNNTLDEKCVRLVVGDILKSKRRGHLALATEFERFGLSPHEGERLVQSAFATAFSERQVSRCRIDSMCSPANGDEATVSLVESGSRGSAIRNRGEFLRIERHSCEDFLVFVSRESM